MMEQEKPPEKNPNETQQTIHLIKEFKEVVISMLTKLQSKIEELRDNFNIEKE